MNPHPVVKDINAIEQFVRRFLSGRKVFVMNHLALQDAKEAFRHRIVPTVALAAHTLRAAPRHALFSEGCADVLATAITMDERRDAPCAPSLPLEKRPLDESDLKTLRDRPPDDEPRVQIKKDDQVEPSFRSPEVGDVRSPDLIQARGAEQTR